MLTNKFPFDTKDHKEVYERNKSMQINFEHARLKKSSDEALDLLRALLKPDLEERITCE
jgi:hypothetical protein